MLLSDSAMPWLDVEAFEAACRRARETRAPGDYRSADQLYRGDLLPEDQFEAWAEAPRDALRERRLGLLIEYAEVLSSGASTPRSPRSQARALVRDRACHQLLLIVNYLPSASPHRELGVIDGFACPPGTGGLQEGRDNGTKWAEGIPSAHFVRRGRDGLVPSGRSRRGRADQAVTNDQGRQRLIVHIIGPRIRDSAGEYGTAELADMVAAELRGDVLVEQLRAQLGPALATPSLA